MVCGGLLKMYLDRFRPGEKPTFRDLVIAIPVVCLVFALVMAIPPPGDRVPHFFVVPYAEPPEPN